METKTCIRCKVEKNINEFYRSKACKSGYRSCCKQCYKTKLDPEIKFINRAKEIQDDYGNTKIVKRCYRCELTKDAIENFHKCSREVDGYMQACKECRKKYYFEKGKKVRQEWKNNNRDSLNEWKRNYERQARKLEHNRIREAWRILLVYSLKKLKQNKDDKTNNLLGYSAKEFSNHIESLWTPGMSWENYGEWHIDHIRPISSFPKDTPPNIVNALSNLRPMWATSRVIDGVFYEGNLNKGARYNENNE